MSLRNGIIVTIEINCNNCGEHQESLREYVEGAARHFAECGWIDHPEYGVMCKDCVVELAEADAA